MPDKQPVIAVIPHYNMPQTLVPLLEQIIKQNYDGVYVLDDHSTNCDIKKVVQPFGSAVQLVVGGANRGAGANRNRILEVKDKSLPGAILHFIDADCELVSTDTPGIVRKLVSGNNRQWFGGLVLNADGSWMKYNFFTPLTLQGFWGSALQEFVTLVHRPDLNRRLRHLSKGLRDFPDVFSPPQAQQVFAVSEANMVISYSIFAEAGGYDPNLRDREVIDLAHRLQAKGYTCYFEPSVAVKHHAVQVRGWTRPLHNVRASWKIIRKYGLRLT